MEALPYLAFTLGLMSSFHCIGMCGPIAMALPVQRGNKWLQFTGLLVYNSGRALSYAFLGSLIGIFGTTIALIGYLQYLTVFAGIVMLLYIIFSSRLSRFLHPPKFWTKALNQLKKGMSGALKSKKMTAWFLLGTLNGLLPCGLVYLALISSIATGSVAGGASYMFIFGMGTLPAMMGVGFFRNWITPVLRRRFHQASPFIIALAGIWLVTRGLLIEYPGNADSSTGTITVCHGK